jgi:hypothetical protein
MKNLILIAVAIVSIQSFGYGEESVYQKQMRWQMEEQTEIMQKQLELQRQQMRDMQMERNNIQGEMNRRNGQMNLAPLQNWLLEQ